MRKREYKPVEANDDGWTDWHSPHPRAPYRMACCDCGLVHDIEFEAVEETNVRKGGWWTSKALTMPWRILMRARRNESETAKLRAREKAA